jgi:hypothetical protein
VRDSPLLLVDCQQVDATPHPDRASEVAGDHAVASGAELDQHDGVGVRLALLLGRLRVLVPNSDPACVREGIPLSQPMARMGLLGCHSMQVGVMERESSYWCLSPL